MTSATASWAEMETGYENVLRRHFVASGRDRIASAMSTIRTNTELVPHGAENLFTLLRALCRIDSLRGRRVVELGCRFGALATYLMMDQQPRELVAVAHV